MDSVRIPETSSLKNLLSPLLPAYVDPKGDFLSWLFDKFPTSHRTVAEPEIAELKQLLENLVPGQVAKDRGALDPSRSGVYQELVQVLREFYKDPLNPTYRPLLRFIEGRPHLMKEVLISVLAEKKGELPQAEKSLGTIALRVADWQTQQKEGSPPFLLGARVLGAIHTEEISTWTDLKPWVETNVIQNPASRASMSPSELQSFYAAIGLGEDPLLPPSPGLFGQMSEKQPLPLLNQIYETAVRYVQEFPLLPEEKEFFQMFLPVLEQSIAERTASPPTTHFEEMAKPTASLIKEEIPLVFTADGKTKEVSKQAIEHFVQSIAESLQVSKEEVHTLLRQLPGMLEFPVIGPYLSGIPFAPRFSTLRTRFQKPPSIEIYEEDDPLEEPWGDEDEEEEEDEEETELRG